ncbi:MAG: CDP-alcohol phosphatidyltransferase family protein [Candidatus Dormibacteria bacterium]
MLKSVDRVFAALILLAALGALVVYVVRLGRSSGGYSRTDAAGGSALLGRRLLETGYLILQPIGQWLAARGVTANMVSWTSLLLGGVAGALLAVGLFGTAAFVASISGLLDTVDGMVARFSGSSSDAGEVLDAAVDRYTEFFFLGGLAIHYRDHPLLVALTLAALIGSFMVSYATVKAEALGVDPPRGLMRRQERAVYLALGAIFTGLLSPALERRLHLPEVQLPMLIALVVVAALANLSAVLRHRALISILRRRGPGSSPLA